MKEVRLELAYHPKQREIFFGSTARFKVIAKGRRFGLTRGMANYVIESMLGGITPVLWVDTVYGNIERYVERYFKPVLSGLPKEMWQYRGNRNDLRIGNAICDFRSADRPENIEGFGYALVVLNEAGIILKNRALWNESIRPMIMDYKARVIIGGTPKGRYVRKKGEEHLFFELFRKGTGGTVGTKETSSLRQAQCNALSPLISKGEGRLNAWESFNFSSYDNPLLDKDEIDEMVAEIPPMLREQEVYGRFVETENEGIIKREWWRFFSGEGLGVSGERLMVSGEGDRKQEAGNSNSNSSSDSYSNRGSDFRDDGDNGDATGKLTAPNLTRQRGFLIQSWDTAFKKNAENDFSVCTTWEYADGNYYLIDMWRGRVEFPELKKKVVELFSVFSPAEVLIEDKASGQSLIQELQRETAVPVKAIRVVNDKITRASIATPLLEAGKVFMPEDVKWKEQVLRECEEFPGGQFDDIVDSITQALNYLKEKERMRSTRIEGIKSKFLEKLERIRRM